MSVKHMKILKLMKFLSLVLAMTLLCLWTAVGCVQNPSSSTENQGNTDAETDALFDPNALGSHPRWLTECLLLPSPPSSLGVTDCFGTAGHSGIASQTLVENEGKLAVNQTSLLVCLYYGHMVNEYAPLQTFLQFTMITPDGVLQDEECVEQVVFSDYPLPSSDWDYLEVDLTLDPENRIPVTNLPENQHQGMYAITFIPKVAGTLQVEFSLSMKDQLISHSVDAYNIAVVAEETDNSAFPLTVEQFDVNFLTEDAFNQGNFADEELAATPPAVPGSVYAIIDYRVKTELDFSTSAEFMIVTSTMGRGFLDVNVEEAATNYNEYFVTEESVLYQNRFTASINKGGVKEGRIALRLKPLDNGTIPVGFFITSTTPMNYNVITSKTHIIHTAPTDFCYSYLNPSGSDGFYTLTSIVDHELETVRVPATMSDHTPVSKIADRAFSLCRNLKNVYISKNINYIGSLAFENCMELSSIDFGGTIAEWETIEKSSTWYGQSGIVKVRCIDGTVEMPPLVMATPTCPQADGEAI